MAKPFSELRNKMSPAARARSRELAREMLAQMNQTGQGVKPDCKARKKIQHKKVLDRDN